MILQTMLFFVWLNRSLCSDLYATQDSNNSVPIRIIDAVVIQGSNGESCPTEKSRNSIIHGLHFTINSLLFVQWNGVYKCRLAGAGWKRMAFLNMSDPDQSCPWEWHLRTNLRRTCERKVDRGCSLTAFGISGSYIEVCGRIIGYQYGSTDALYGPIVGRTTLDQASNQTSVMDGGVQLARGSSPRRHIILDALWWKFPAGSQ